MSKKLDIKNTGFETPKNYFDSVEDSVLAKLKTEKLKELVTNTGYEAPKEYLSNIEDSVLDKLSDKPVKVISLNVKRMLYSVASIAAILVLYFAVFNSGNNSSLDSIESEVVERYFIDNGIDSDELASLLTEEDLESMNLDLFDEDLSTETLEDYILENIELETILEQ
ncbi:MAG: hypothetical protein ACWA5P_08425 [bacterium]